MSDNNNLQRVILARLASLACGLALGCAPFGARAASARHLAAVRDERGRVVYVNAYVNADDPSASAPFSTGPRSVFGFIQQASERFQLDPGLLEAIIRVESGYNPRAVSSKGALGLMQLIPATAKRFGVQNPFDARENIEGGASYLRYLLQLFSGDVRRSLAAYNAGEHSVLRSVERDGSIPRIPETEEYVRKVTALYGQVSGAGGQDSGAGDSRQRRSLATNAQPRIYSFVDAQGVTHFEQ